MDSIRSRQAEVLRRVLESDRIDLHTALPGVIRSYDEDTQTADIALGVKRVLPAADDDDADDVEDYPILPSVPVCWPRGSGGYLHIPLSAGDGVLVVFSESDLSRWRETGEAGEDPGVATRHGLSGAIALAGLHWRGNANADAPSGGPETPKELRLGVEGSARIAIRPGRIIMSQDGPGLSIQAGGSDALAKASPTSSILDAIASDLALLAARFNAAAGPMLSAPGTVTLTTPIVQAANPIATNTLTGA